MPHIKKFNLFFIHIPKNAGKSVEAALLGSKIHDPSWQRRRSLNRFAKWMLNNTSHKRPHDVLHGTIDMSFATQHLSITELETVRPDFFHNQERPIMFAVVRNPWQRAISTYKHFSASTDITPEGFFHFWSEDRHHFFSSRDHNRIAHARSQISYLFDSEGKFAIDFILRFENLVDDFHAFSDKFQSRSELPHIGPSRAIDHSKYFKRPMMELLADKLKADIDFLGYSDPCSELVIADSKLPRQSFLV